MTRPVARLALPAIVLLAIVLLALAPRLAAAFEVQRVVSPGGIEAWLVEDRTIPVVSLSVEFRGGTALDPAGKEGLASLAAGLMDEAAGDLDNKAFTQRLAELSISLGFGAGRDHFTGSIRSLAENRDAAFEMLALALARPRFDPADVARVRAATLNDLARRATDPSAIASRTFYNVAFEGHPYAHPPQGTPETVQRITIDDLRAFPSSRLARDRMIVGVAGAIGPAELGPLLDRAFGALPATAAAGEVGATDIRSNGDVVVVRLPIPQSIVTFGQNGIRRNDPDWYAAFVLNYVLGGGSFGSRLMHEVREKRGLAYGISTALQPMEHAGLIVGRVATRNARVAETIAVVKAEWRRMAEEGISEEELANAKTYLTGSFPLQLDSTSSIAGLLVAMQRNGLGIDYLDRRNGLINGVTADDVKRVARRLLDPGKLTVVVVGEPSEVTATRPAPGAG